MTITFDVLGRFQENKVWQTAQTMNNTLSQIQNGSFINMETVTFKIEIQGNVSLALILQIM